MLLQIHLAPIIVAAALGQSGEPDPPLPPDDPAPRFRPLSLDDLGRDTPAAVDGDAADADDADADTDDWTDALTSNLRFGFDVGGRVAIDSYGDVSTFAFAGVDVLKVFSSGTQDWGTLKIQTYLTRLDNADAPPRHFEGRDDWDVLYCDVFFEYTGLGRAARVRVGHFDVPFGLEPMHDTNLTLRQFTNEENLGIKSDWGVAIGGELADFEYEAALTRGSGNELSARGDPFAVTGRIGTAREANVVFGVSAAVADVQVVPGKAVSRDIIEHRWRLGADAQWHVGPFSLMGEASWGENEAQQFESYLAELDWHDSSARWYLYLQGQYFNREYAFMPEEYFATYVGVRYVPDGHWTVSAQWKQYIERWNPSYRDDGVFTLQVRYRF